MSEKDESADARDPFEEEAIRRYLERKKSGVKQRSYSSEEFKRFRQKIGAEIERTGALTEEFVNELRRQLRGCPESGVFGLRTPKKHGVF